MIINFQTPIPEILCRDLTNSVPGIAEELVFIDVNIPDRIGTLYGG